ncbi:polysaccharide biosynthesis protein [Paenibacillus chitinolyticus]|uniref:polysaccharide biosynthesis protein n=1 Tax=Paenibacillus chitinolyticus TaxID=79263 RepID=UPI001C472A9E|nr:nucleoside-diphosphate sugar epimerase/dehydratase [Paenibacillus chitinolyticus]MBV6713469.1 polysaccharide biosynthesis protein [Paenibacillus chitinolyticus]
MRNRNKVYVFMLLDVLVIWGSVWLSYLLRFDGAIPASYITQGLIFSLVLTFTTLSSLVYFKLYNRVWQYASIGEMVSLFKAVTLSSILSYLAVTLAGQFSVPTSIFLSSYQCVFFLMGGLRFVRRMLGDNYYKKKGGQRAALIIGAGDCGIIITKELKHNPQSLMYPAAFIDDDKQKHKQQICGIPVVGGRDQIVSTVSRLNIDEIIIAIPSASKSEILGIIEICKQTKAKLKMIPKISDLIHGRVSIKEIRDVDVEDLLGRDPVKVDLYEIANYVEGKVVLVTGAGGSIGSELCRQVGPYNPKKLLLLGHGENSIYTIEMQLRQLYPALQLETVIADIQDVKRIEDVFAEYEPQVVFHAAAHKHVPLMERNPSEAIKNNVFGTKNVADCANRFRAERFVMISTDKAVNPTSVMGTTKRVAEMYIQSLNASSDTIFAAVRFGNVLGSRGSVIPRFKEQIANGGPVTVTHPDMIRYFMTIPEAVQLVIQAGAFARGGEVFILDMGKPVKIVDLATDLIRLSGFDPNSEIAIEFTGMRPGEKLYEELLTQEEGLSSTLHNRIFIGKPANINHAELQFQLNKLNKSLVEEDSLRDKLKEIVPAYQHKPENKKELSLV